MNALNTVRLVVRPLARRPLPRPQISRSQQSVFRPIITSSRLYSTEKTVEAESPAEGKSNGNGEKVVEETEEQKALKAKDAEILDLTSRLRYLSADFQNLQRISEREKQLAKEFAISKFATDLLTTVDVLALALKSVPVEARSGSAANPRLVELYTGVELTEKQLLQTLAQHGVKPYDPLGEKFDPNRHEALYSAPAPQGKEPGTVIDVQKLGYTIRDRTLRAPQVGVAAEAT